MIDEMNGRIEKIMNYYKMTATEFSKETNIKPSTLSHILRGRNIPKTQLINFIIQRFPAINERWLLIGEGEMLKSGSEDESSQFDLFSKAENDEVQKQESTENQVTGEGSREDRESLELNKTNLTEDIDEKIKSPADNSDSRYDIAQQTDKSLENVVCGDKLEMIENISSRNPDEIVKMIFFYSDGTFESFAPRKK